MLPTRAEALKLANEEARNLVPFLTYITEDKGRRVFIIRLSETNRILVQIFYR